MCDASLLYGGLLRGRGAADSARQHSIAVHVECRDASEFHRAQAGPLLKAKLRTLDSARPAILTMNSRNIIIAAILTQSDVWGHQHSVTYESSKLTAVKSGNTKHTSSYCDTTLGTFPQVLVQKGGLQCDGSGRSAVSTGDIGALSQH